MEHKLSDRLENFIPLEDVPARIHEVCPPEKLNQVVRDMLDSVYEHRRKEQQKTKKKAS